MTLIKINHFFVAAFMFLIYKSKLLEKKIPVNSNVRINFDDAPYFHELVMIFAYLDAFMDDTLRIIYECCPEKLKCERKITWETVIDLKSYKRLIDYIISKFVRKEFRNLPIKNRVEFLEERADIELDIPEKVLENFAIAEQARHIIIHNAGRIDSEFLVKTKLKNLKTGDIFPISYQYVDDLSHAIQKLASIIFREVSTKFLDIPEVAMDWTWKFPKTENSN